MDADERRKQLSAALNRVASADRVALRLVYDMTAAKLFGLCLRILNDRSEAEDVLQDVYMTVWQKARPRSTRTGRVRSLGSWPSHGTGPSTVRGRAGLGD